MKTRKVQSLNEKKVKANFPSHFEFCWSTGRRFRADIMCTHISFHSICCVLHFLSHNSTTSFFESSQSSWLRNGKCTFSDNVIYRSFQLQCAWDDDGLTTWKNYSIHHRTSHTMWSTGQDIKLLQHPHTLLSVFCILFLFIVFRALSYVYSIESARWKRAD